MTDIHTLHDTLFLHGYALFHEKINRNREEHERDVVTFELVPKFQGFQENYVFCFAPRFLELVKL